MKDSAFESVNQVENNSHVLVHMNAKCLSPLVSFTTSESRFVVSL